MPAHWNTQKATKHFRKHWTKNPDGLLEICLDRFEELHGNRDSQLPKRTTSELIEWFLSHNTWDQENQQWNLTPLYSRIERSDIYYELCGWIK